MGARSRSDCPPAQAGEVFFSRLVWVHYVPHSTAEVAANIATGCPHRHTSSGFAPRPSAQGLASSRRSVLGIPPSTGPSLLLTLTNFAFCFRSGHGVRKGLAAAPPVHLYRGRRRNVPVLTGGITGSSAVPCTISYMQEKTGQCTCAG